MAQDAVQIVHLDVGFQFDLLFAGQGAARRGGKGTHPLPALFKLSARFGSGAVFFSGCTVGQPLCGQLLGLLPQGSAGGGKAGLFAGDELTRQNCAEHGRPGVTMSLAADEGAVYERVVDIDVTGQEPVVACPHLPSNVKNVSELKDLSVQQVVVGSCTNGRISDMRDAAEILRGRKVAKGVRCIILPSTPAVWKQCLKEGLMEVFMDAGCIVGPCTCGPCLGGHMGILGDGERAVATTNRNFRGRMGSLDSEVYLSSPVVAAASAVAGCIAGPDQL